MIWIIGGTSETRIILDRIKDLKHYIVTIATPEGKEFIDTENLAIGRMDDQEMIHFVQKHRVSLIVDLSHPYAKIVSENSKKIAEAMDIPYIRYERERTGKRENAIYLSSYEECYDYLTNIKGTVFFTTGCKNIGDFEQVRGDNRFIYRVLPALQSIEACTKHNIAIKDILAVLGPFSKEFNKAMLAEYHADYCVMKDSGRQGGTLEKILACQELSILPIIIGRDEDTGINDIDRIEEIIRLQHKALA